MRRGLLHALTLAAVLALAPAVVMAEPLELGDSAFASVLTCGPGDDFYLAFGHSALRVCDPGHGLDVVFNYGCFDFNTPHFYLRFAGGRLDYFLDRVPYVFFMDEYAAEGRAVWEQRLNLEPRQVANLLLMLEYNRQPDYRYYRYDFFRDNCATRVVDMVEAACGHSSLNLLAGSDGGTTYRRYVHRAAAGGWQWWLLGVDMLLGLPADHRCTPKEACFYPLELKECLAGASMDGQRFARRERQLLPDVRGEWRRGVPPLAVTGLLLAVLAALTLLERRQGWVGRVLAVADRVLFALAGLAGVVLLLMWFATDHSCTAWNPNLLWASPLLALVAIRMDKSPLWALWLIAGGMAVAAVWVVVCGASVALLPLIAALALRVSVLIRRKPRRQRLPR
ncbi:MAG: DUF4105 domain-containing protein [Bacteroidales bacterium]|nr:DUF4105 domain-containing protein [Bacteroidales bacterium]